MPYDKSHKSNRILASLICVGVLGIPSHMMVFAEDSSEATQTTHHSLSLQTLDGKLLRIEGNFYVVEDGFGKQHRLRLSRHATLLRGPKKPGDVIRVEVIDARAITIQ